ncbi:MAG: methyltransferase domain-containing protein, partial [Deltaproteobacteria bacterium]|nr:methyltransferase domain-containing protein [Deltaproteobacteria bacterium]
MRKGNPFNEQHVRYEAWFTHHETAYYSELLAIRAFLPGRGSGLEIGVGTGRFAGPLGVQVGVDPSGAMLAYAVERGITGAQGMAEMLPFKEEVFDYALVVTTLCFVQDPMRMLAEAHRVLKPEAPLVIGFVDRASELGQHYLSHQSENVFYREAKFYSASEVGELLRDTGFHEQIWAQTLSKPLGQIQEIEPFREGLGSGGFVVVKAIRRRSLAAKEGEQFHRSGDLTDLENISHRDVDGFSRRAKEAEQKITILYEITRFVSSLLDVQLVLDAIVNLLVEEFNLDACSIRLLDADGKLRIKSQKG